VKSIDPPTYEAGIRAFEGSIPAALDGSKTAVALKNKLKGAAVNMYNELAHYVEANCHGDMATFMLSGLIPASMIKAAPAPVETPTMTVASGPLSGQLKGKIKGVKKALSYVVRRGVVLPGGGVPATWIEDVITSSKPFIITNLTPGTVYAFQVKALGRMGYTDWSDPINRMAT
jgi:hypothetical protein